MINIFEKRNLSNIHDADEHTRSHFEISDVYEKSKLVPTAMRANKLMRADLYQDMPIECRSSLEWILLSVSKKKAKSWARKLHRNFGSLSITLSADVDVLVDVLDGNLEPALHLNRLSRTIHYIAQCEVRYGHVSANWPSIIGQLQRQMGYLRIEHFRLLMLDSGHRLIDDKLVWKGTFSEVACYPREVVRYALLSQAAGVILVHNHPSGNPTMSQADKDITTRTQYACNTVGVELCDHLVICRDSYSSYRADNPLWARTRQQMQ